MIETLATCLCKQMLFCYLTNESLRHQRRQEKDNCLYTADFLVGCQKSGEKLRIQWKHKHNFKTTTLKFAFVLLKPKPVK